MILFWCLCVIISSVTAITDPKSFVSSKNTFRVIEGAYDPEQCNCINVKQCEPFLTMLKKHPIPHEDLRFMQNSTCGFLGTHPYVCCPETNLSETDSNELPSLDGFPLNNDDDSNGQHVPRPSREFNGIQPKENVPENEERKTTTVIKTTITTETVVETPKCRNSNDDKHKISLFPPDCGFSLQATEFGQSPPRNHGMFPWIARLGYRETKVPEYVYRCGGVLINKNYILTSAYCAAKHDQFQLATIRLGEYDSRVETDCDDPEKCRDFRQDFRPEKVKIHEGYDNATMENDIALIKLDRDVVFNIDVRAICLPFQWSSLKKHTFNRDFTGSSAVVAGWGITDIRREASILYLQHGLVHITDTNACKSQQENTHTPQLCISSNSEHNLDINDNGGPLMIAETSRNRENLLSRYYAIAIASIHREHREFSNKYHRFYTPVYNYNDWILNHID